MDKTKIEWCDSTWNPITGCLNGCEYCYARRIAERFGGKQKSANVFEENEPVIGEDGKALAYPHSFSPTLHRYRLGEYEKKKGRTIFVCSMADLFGDWVPDEWIEEVFKACEKAPQHRYLFLTKNPRRYVGLAEDGKLPAKDNMWYGTTATMPDEQFFWGGEWHTFVSVEPMLQDYCGEMGETGYIFEQWAIVGAETGNRKGKVTPEKSWIDAMTKACIERGICLFMKDSLIPIVGEENMFRELPWDSDTWETDRQQGWLDGHHDRKEG